MVSAMTIPMPRRLAVLLPRCLVAFALLLPPTVLAAPIDPDNPPQGTFLEEWMIVRLGGQKAGYAESTMTREGDRITTRTITVISLARAGQTIDISMMESTRETVAGVPISFENVQSMATFKTSTKGRIHDGKVSMENSQLGMTRTDEVVYPEGALMSWGLFAEQTRRGYAEGLAYELKAFVPSLMADKPVTTKIDVAGRETVDLLGKSVEGVRVNTVMDTPMGSIRAVNWVDADGRIIKSDLELMGLGKMELLRADKETATQQAPAPEFFVSTLVKADQRIDSDAAQRIRYRLRLKGEGDPLPDLPVTAMQQPGARTPDGMELVVSRLDRAPLKEAPPAAASDELSEYLQPNLWVNSDDPEVVTMAKEAAGDAKTPYEIADRLRVHVSKAIEQKNLNVAFATASEVCRNREGDCSEHGVLLAALGRVHKIPARVVIGLVYVPHFAGEEDVFGFHMWDQFYIGGKWVDFDAALGESDCSPTHLAVATSSLYRSSLAELSFGLLNIIGRLEIDIVEADPPSAVTARQTATAPATN